MKTSRKKLSALIDWLTIIFEGTDAYTVIREYLALPIEIFEKDYRGIQYKEYDTRYTFGQLVLFSIEQQPDKQECYLTLSGEGCRQFEKHLERNHQTWELFFRNCFSYSDSVVRMTRIDVAIDDKNEVPFFTIKELYQKAEHELYKSISQTHSYTDSKFSLNDGAKTLYIGAQKSRVRFRFYDKDKEQAIKKKLPMDNLNSWKRTEIQLRDEYATQMCKQIAFSQKDLGKLIFGFLKENLTFYTETGELFRPWERFIGSVEPLKLKATNELTTLYDTQNWLETGGILAILKGFKLLEENNALGRLQSVEELLPQALFSRSFSQKLVTHVSMLNRVDLVKMIQEQTKKAEF
ncbi:replication initiation factor domain-containing protein [Enterococcus sp. BWB1-3]|uniref:replication initiation factor domain-containing protein n=1 Tax=Enterococcus sp. BWB1-3 TaxID=2787713 RepID=UPI0019245861|nr:replication initiation factor domain-containing protein [Enterococcus sp. BWB1-3]MBL1231002.1 replication initiation factor domain-containing protein [Enterococcus sp. BWB1-3]